MRYDLQVRQKLNYVLEQAMTAQTGSRSIVLLQNYSSAIELQFCYRTIVLLQKYSSTIEVQFYSFLNLGARESGWPTPLPSRFTPGKEPRYSIYWRLQGPVWRCAENLVPTALRSPYRPARSDSLYRSNHPGRRIQTCRVLWFSRRCNRELRFSGVWRHVVGLSVPHF